MNRVEEYIQFVHEHPQLCGKWVKLAVKRFESDLKRQGTDAFPYVYDERKASIFVRFTELLKQYKDVWAGQRLHLEPWQVFIFANVYGWVHKDTGLRRFRKAFVYVCRKNGKSTMVASVLLNDLLRTAGGEAYCAAVKRDQAKIVWSNVEQMVRQNADLKELVSVYKSSSTITCDMKASKLTALASESDSLDGLNPSAASIDELAAMKNYDLIQVLQSGTVSRPEPLLFEITSGSTNPRSAGAMEFDRAAKILDGVYEDNSFFCIMYKIDKGDNWMNEKNWAKANPNLGVSVRLDSLRSQCLEARQNPMLEAEFRTKNCGEFLSSEFGWISHTRWEVCMKNVKKYPEYSQLRPEDCVAVGAVDLSKRLDFTAFDVCIYHIPTGMFYLKHHFFIPEEQIEDKCKTDSPLIRKWISQGYITATPGGVVNYGMMFDNIRDCIEKYKIEDILYDPWNAGRLIDEIGPLCNLIEIRQNLQNLSPMAKDFESAVVKGEIVDDNPVMSWMISNCDVYKDQSENIKPVKHGGKDSTLHIDGVITSLMALGRIRSMLDAGYIDNRSAEEIEADMEKRLSSIEY